MIQILFQPHGPITGSGLANPGDSALVLTGTKREKEFAARIATALEALYTEGRELGIFETLEVLTSG